MKPLIQHWDAVYAAHGSAAGAPSAVSWYTPQLVSSLAWIDRLTGGDPAARILDAGTGESTLADDLLARGQGCLTLLDLSATALAHLRARLLARFGAPACAHIAWLAGDVTALRLPEAGTDLWHDRAVLHFLTRPSQQAAYAAQAARAVRPGGHLVLSVFATDGPPSCSALEVSHWDADGLAQLFAPAFEPLAAGRTVHVTPSGAAQAFVEFVARRRAAAAAVRPISD